MLVESPAARGRSVVQFAAPQVRPGRFARAALAGMVVLAENLWQTHPDFVEAVRTGEPLSADAGMRFLMGVTPWEERQEIHGAHQRVAASISLDGSLAPKPEKTLSAMVQWLPFSLVLVDSEVAPTFTHVDCTSWLGFGVDEVVPLSLELPCLRVMSDWIATAQDYKPSLV